MMTQYAMDPFAILLLILQGAFSPTGSDELGDSAASLHGTNTGVVYHAHMQNLHTLITKWYFRDLRELCAPEAHVRR